MIGWHKDLVKVLRHTTHKTAQCVATERTRMRPANSPFSPFLVKLIAIKHMKSANDEGEWGRDTPLWQ